MKRYLIQGEGFDGFILLTYAKLLVHLEINADLSQEQHLWILGHLPMVHTDLLDYRKKITKNGTITMIEYKEDLTFDHFWDTYNHKMSNKKRALGLWNKLNNAQRRKAIFYIRRYERYLKTVTHAKLHADSYLKQERWNN